MPTQPDLAAPPPRLFLVTPRLARPDAAFARALALALEAADVASVLLRAAAPDLSTIVADLAPLVQGRGAALLIEGDARAAILAGADGAHVSCAAPGFEARLDEAARALQPDRILGAGGLASRDDAMSAGERNVDYVMFGDDDGLAPDALVERVAWWADIFTPPCVACAHDLAAIPALVAAGADFIALGDALWADPRGVADALKAAAAALARREPAS